MHLYYFNVLHMCYRCMLVLPVLMICALLQCMSHSLDSIIYSLQNLASFKHKHLDNITVMLYNVLVMVVVH